jgi:PLP dependent protein
MTNIVENLANIKEKVIKAANKANRDPGEIILVAVSKTHEAEKIEEAYNAGQRHFGENYGQELRDKAARLNHLKDIKWHFIGHLQTNKVKYVAPYASYMECIDSEKIAHAYLKGANKFQKEVSLFLQVNLEDEPSKSGCQPREVLNLIDKIKSIPGANLKGLMTIPPYELEKEETRKYFIKLKKLRDEVRGVDLLPHLSMGMSHDFEVAIEEGSTVVRVGTAIFGSR